MKPIAKRITLFPSDAKPLTEESLMDYIRAFGDLKYIPFVNRGIAIAMGNPGDTNPIPREIFTVDLRNKDNSITISISAERIDIISSAQDDFSKFLETSELIFRILDSIHSSGYNRIATGAEFLHAYSREEINKMMEGSTKIPFNQEVVEWSERSASRKSFSPDNSDVTLLYNDVTTIYINISEDNSDSYKFKTEYDINTYIPQNKEIISCYKKDFLNMAINLINRKVN